MKKIIIICLFLGSLCFGKNMTFILESKAIKNGVIEQEYGGKGKDVINGVGSKSIPLEWENPPEGTKSFAVVMVDHDAIPVVGVTWIHWSVANIPVYRKKLEADESRNNKKIIQGANSWISPIGGFSREEASFYGGPMPPDKDHVYEITIYALDKELDIKNGYYLNELYEKMKGHVLGTSVLEGIYKK